MRDLVSAAGALVLAPLLPGVINKTKAAFAGRQGPPVLQLYHDLFKLLRKGAVYSRATTWVFRAGPIVSLSAVLVASCLVPMAGVSTPLSFAGDIVVFVYLFGLARFFTVAAALDTGSSFEGMGASRDVAFSLLAEPALFIGFLVLAQGTGASSLRGMLGKAFTLWPAMGGPLVLVAVSFFVVGLAENSRIPVDDPATHLELTMVHEVMALDHGGPDLAFILYGASLKLFVTLSLLAHILLPMDAGSALRDWALFTAAVAALAAGVGVVESVMARLRMVRVPRLLMAACVIAAFGMILAL